VAAGFRAFSSAGCGSTRRGEDKAGGDVHGFYTSSARLYGMNSARAAVDSAEVVAERNQAPRLARHCLALPHAAPPFESSHDQLAERM
jgi:hypothetical protein